MIRAIIVPLVAFAATLNLTPAASAQEAEPGDTPVRLLLLGQGPDGHDAGTHEYHAGVRIMAACLERVEGLEVTIANADEPWSEGPELLQKADGVVMFLSEGARWLHADADRLEAFAQLAARRGGLTAVHWAMGTKEARYIEGYLKLLGGCHGGDDRKYTVVETDLALADPKHPIAQGLADFHIRDEFYYRLKMVKGDRGVRPIVTASIEGEQETLAWAWERPDGGRSFGFCGCHFHENWKRPEYRRLVCQGILWSLKLPVPEGGLAVDIDESLLVLPEVEGGESR